MSKNIVCLVPHCMFVTYMYIHMYCVVLKLFHACHASNSHCVQDDGVDGDDDK